MTVLAQLTAGSFGTGWPFYVSNIAITAVLGLAANTSFGGLPVLLSLLAKDHRLPHLFYLRAERPVYRVGVGALAVASLLLLVAVSAETNKLIPLYAIGVFLGFTLSQIGLVRHWRKERPSRWRLRVAINRDRGGDDRGRRGRVPGQQVHRGGVGRGPDRARVDVAVRAHRDATTRRWHASSSSAARRRCRRSARAS